MIPYREFAPTDFDAAGLNAHDMGTDEDPDRSEWLVAPVSRTRDSGPLAESNFSVFLGIVGGESDDVEVHRFGHWGPGWFEIILVRPGTKAATEAERAESSLDDYPVLDEMDYSAREWEANEETWRWMSLRDRVGLIREARARCARWGCANPPSVFAARRDEIPADPIGYISERLAQD